MRGHDVMSLITVILMAMAILIPNGAAFTTSLWGTKTSELYSVTSDVESELFGSLLLTEGSHSHSHRQQPSLLTTRRTSRRTARVILPESSGAILVSAAVAEESPAATIVDDGPDVSADFEGDGATNSDEFMSLEQILQEGTTSSSSPSVDISKYGVDEGYVPKALQGEGAKYIRGTTGRAVRIPVLNILLRVKDRRHETQANRLTFSEKLEMGDYHGILMSNIIPLGIVATAAGFGGTKLFGKYRENLKETLQNYAEEMVLYDGDADDMIRCHKSYDKQLLAKMPIPWVRKKTMIALHLEELAGSITICPESIEALEDLLISPKPHGLHCLKEEALAGLLVAAAKEDKVASAQKLLFIGERILRNNSDALAALQPIRDMLAGEQAGGASMVEEAQKAMAEAAYVATVTAAGKNQKKMTEGWELLGLTREKAEEIFSAAFMSDFKSAKAQAIGDIIKQVNEKGLEVDENGKELEVQGADNEEEVYEDEEDYEDFDDDN